MNNKKPSLTVQTGGIYSSPPSSRPGSRPGSAYSNRRSRPGSALSSKRSPKTPGTRRSGSISTRSRRSTSRNGSPKVSPRIRPISDFGWSSEDVFLLNRTINKLIHKKLSSGWYCLCRGFIFKKLEQTRLRNEATLASMIVSAGKLPRVRLQSDIVHIKRWAKEVHKGVFNDMDDNEITQFAKGVKLQSGDDEDKLLFLQGSTGKEYFIVVKGTVQIYGETDRHRVSVKLELQKECGADHLMQDHFSKDVKYFGNALATLKKGKSFGEVALFSENSIRTATAVACCIREIGIHAFRKPKPTILLKIERDVYMNTFARHHQAAWEQQRKIKLLRGLLYFKQCTYDRIVDASYLFVRSVQERGTVLLEDQGLHIGEDVGDRENGGLTTEGNFFIIMDGSLKSIRRRAQKKTNNKNNNAKEIKKQKKTNVATADNEAKKRKLALEEKYKGGSKAKTKKTTDDRRPSRDHNTEGNENVINNDGEEGENVTSTTNGPSSLSSLSASSSSSLSILKHYELSSRQSYVELSTTHGTTVYGVSNLLRKADANRYNFLRQTEKKVNDIDDTDIDIDTDIDTATTTVVCTSRVEMYILKPHAMSTLLDYLRGTSAIETLYQLYTHRKTHSKIQTDRVDKLFDVPPPLKPKSKEQRIEENKEKIEQKNRARLYSEHRKHQQKHKKKKYDRPGTAPIRGGAKSVGTFERPNTAPRSRRQHKTRQPPLPPRPTSSTASLRSTLLNRDTSEFEFGSSFSNASISSISSFNSSISSLSPSLTQSFQTSMQNRSKRPSTAPMSRKTVEKLLNSIAQPHFGATVFRRKVAMLPSKKNRFDKVDLVSHHMSEAFANSKHGSSNGNIRGNLTGNGLSLRAMAGTIQGSVAVWLKHREDGKERQRQQNQRKIKRKVRRTPFYVTRDRSKRKARTGLVKKRVTTDTLKSRALENALDRELGRRLSKQRLLLGLKA